MLAIGSLTGPIIYILWRGSLCLYVGMSLNGFHRILSKDHSAITKAIGTDTLEIRYYPKHNKSSLGYEERRLIRKLSPAWNKQLH